MLKGNLLRGLSKHTCVDYEEEKLEKFGDVGVKEARDWFPVKPVMVKKLTERIPEYGVEGFFEEMDRDTLLGCCMVIVWFYMMGLLLLVVMCVFFGLLIVG